MSKSLNGSHCGFPKRKVLFYFQHMHTHSHIGSRRLVTIIKASHAKACIWYIDTVGCLSDQDSMLLFPFCLSTPNCLEQLAASRLPSLSCKKESCFVSVSSFSCHELISSMVGRPLVLDKVCQIFKTPQNVKL